jgi:hypothetical protein
MGYFKCRASNKRENEMKNFLWPLVAYEGIRLPITAAPNYGVPRVKGAGTRGFSLNSAIQILWSPWEWSP